MIIQCWRSTLQLGYKEPRWRKYRNECSSCHQTCKMKYDKFTILESLRNHDDDGNKNPTNLHIWQWKTVFLHPLHAHFSFFDILLTFSLFLRREMAKFLQLWGQRERTMTNVQFCLLMSKALVPVQFQDSFSSIMSLNNWKKWLQKGEGTFPDDVLAFVDVVFA